MFQKTKFFIALVLCLLTFSCQNENKTSSDQPSFNVEFESYELDNGLKVILHRAFLMDNKHMVMQRLLRHYSTLLNKRVPSNKRDHRKFCRNQ